MFAKACKIASQFTYPLMLAYRRYDGQCAVSFSTFVVINPAGWIVTANHTIDLIGDLFQSFAVHEDLVRRHNDRLNDPRLSADQKQQWATANAFSPEGVTDIKLWWGGLSTTDALLNGLFLAEMDLAVAQLEGYSPPPTIRYPRFQDQTEEMVAGSSLCKLGFALTHVQPVFDEQTHEFRFLEGPTTPLLFPLDGILTRITEHLLEEVTYPFPCLSLETSTPSLPGHSGGPLVDVAGDIWAIGSQTRYYPLDPADGAEPSSAYGHQYLPLGVGIHAATITGFLRHHQVAYYSAT